MSTGIFLAKTLKISGGWGQGPQTPLASGGWGLHSHTPGWGSPFAESWVRHLEKPMKFCPPRNFGPATPLQPIDEVVKDIAIGVECFGFVFRAGRTGWSVANGSLSLRCFFTAVLRKRSAAEMNPATSYTLRRNTILP